VLLGLAINMPISHGHKWKEEWILRGCL